MKKNLQKQIKKIEKRGERIINLLTSPLTKINKKDIYSNEFRMSQNSYVDDKNIFHLVIEYDIPLGKIK